MNSAPNFRESAHDNLLKKPTVVEIPLLTSLAEFSQSRIVHAFPGRKTAYPILLEAVTDIDRSCFRL
jgi:hypothetical protein